MKHFKYLIVALVFSSCSILQFYSTEISGTWVTSEYDDGEIVAEQIDFGESIEKEVVLGEGSTQKLEEGTYCWQVLHDGEIVSSLEVKGTYQIDPKKMTVVFQPEDELAEVKSFNFMIRNNGWSMDLVAAKDKESGTGRRYSKQ